MSFAVVFWEKDGRGSRRIRISMAVAPPQAVELICAV
jgi:hypothetical protein